MKKMGLAMAFVGMLAWSQPAWAGVDDWAPVRWVKNSVRYVWEPVNCPIDYLNKNISGHTSQGGDLWDVLGCVGDNLNRVPTTLTPIIP